MISAENIPGRWNDRCKSPMTGVCSLRAWELRGLLLLCGVSKGLPQEEVRVINTLAYLYSLFDFFIGFPIR